MRMDGVIGSQQKMKYSQCWLQFCNCLTFVKTMILCPFNICMNQLGCLIILFIHMHDGFSGMVKSSFIKYQRPFLAQKNCWDIQSLPAMTLMRIDDPYIGDQCVVLHFHDKAKCNYTVKVYPSNETKVVSWHALKIPANSKSLS